MKATQTLATIAIMGALNSCSAPSISLAEINLPNNSPIKDKVIKNYGKLASKTPLALFFPQDAKLLRAILKEMASIPRGQELIAAIKDAPELTMFEDEDTTAKASYDVSRAGNSVSLNYKNVYSSTMKDLAISMMHELLHHLQEEQGRFSYGNYFSPEQYILVSKLSEAETFSWDDVLRGTQNFFSKHKDASYDNLQPLMQANLVAEAHREATREGKRFNAESFKKTDALYLFQQALLQTGGDRAKAEKIAVGKRIALYMAPDIADGYIAGWRYSYDFLSVEYAIKTANLFRLSSIGNPKALEKVISYMSDTYGVNKNQINKVHLCKDAQEYRDEVLQQIYKSKILSHGDRTLLRRNGKTKQAKDASFEK